MIREFFKPAPEQIETSPTVSDEVKTTTCYMCACRCGIKVHMLDGQIRYIEGNPDHPVNKGVLCAKGSAGIMNHYSPAKLTKPLKRIGERGKAEFQEIEWDEALGIATGWLDAVRRSDPRKLAFFTGRDQSQALTGWWASQFGTPNYAAHGGFCSVNMAAAGLYTIGGSFWEFGEPDWDRTRYFMMFGVAEDHDSNPIKAGLTKVKRSGAKFVSVNPIRTGYSAVADEWIGIRPGTDGMLVLALVHELLRAGKVDLDYIVRYTNLPWLVIRDEGAAGDGLFARGADGEPLCWDGATGQAADARLAGVSPALKGEFSLADGSRAVPAFQIMAQRYLDEAYSPEAAARETGIAASTIRRLAAELAEAAFEREIVLEQRWTDWAGRTHDTMIGRPVSMHAMRGISAHSNGFHTCRAIHMLQVLLGSIDCPGGFLYKPPFPKAAPPGLRPVGRPGEINPATPMAGPPLGFPQGPEDLLIEADGAPRRIDKAFSWDAPIAAHGMMHMVIRNAWAHDPYPIDVLFMYMANMAWNSSMNTAGTLKMLTDRDEATGEYRIPKIIYSDAFFSEMVAYADLVLPDTTYLERWDCISLLDRPICSPEGPADSIRQPVVAPDRDVRPFQDALIDIGARLGLPGLVKEDGSPRYPGGYADYIVNHERAPGIGMLAGWRGETGDSHGTGGANPDQLQRYIDNGCFWQGEIPPDQRYFRHANRGYLEYAVSMGFVGHADQIVLQIYSEPLQRFRLAAQGHGDVQPPDAARNRIETYFDPLPIWYAPFEGAALEEAEYPLHALTQRPMAMYHSWHSQNAWLRQIHGSNPIYVNRGTAAALDIEDGDWVWLTSHHGRIKGRAKLMEGVNGATVWTWNAIGKRAGAWNLAPDAPEAKTSVLLNHTISDLLPEKGDGMRWSNSDPVTGQAAWYDLRVRLEKAAGDEAQESGPQFDAIRPLDALPARPAILRYGLRFSRAWRRTHVDGGRT
ncbi:MAG: molybdopterin-dependent oxidoreductase [Alphaproteobacteria bacterium]|nr:molybdopterin-dependent oxidoreductase [Alphaproteobacteria bacterium]